MHFWITQHLMYVTVCMCKQNEVNELWDFHLHVWSELWKVMRTSVNPISLNKTTSIGSWYTHTQATGPFPLVAVLVLPALLSERLCEGMNFYNNALLRKFKVTVYRHCSFKLIVLSYFLPIYHIASIFICISVQISSLITLWLIRISTGIHHM